MPKFTPVLYPEVFSDEEMKQIMREIAESPEDLSDLLTTKENYIKLIKTKYKNNAYERIKILYNMGLRGKDLN